MNFWKALTLLTILGVGLSRTILIAESDSFWQIRSGRDFMTDGNFMRPDSYSWVMAGSEYISNSWLWNVILAGIYGLGSFTAVAVFTGLCSCAVLGLLAFYLRMKNISWGHTFAGVSISALLIAGWLTARPQIFDYLLLLVGMIVVHRLSSSPLKVFGFLGLLILLWNNLHLTGPVGAVCFGGLYFMAYRQVPAYSTRKNFVVNAVRSVSLVAFLLLMCLLTPYGIDGITKPFVTVASSAGLIVEWVSPWDFTEPANMISALGLAIVLIPIIFFVAKRRWTEAAFLTGLFFVGADQARWVPFVMLMAAPYLCEVISKFPQHDKISFGPYLKSGSVAVVFSIMAVGSVTFIGGDRVSGGEYGYTLMNQIPENCKMYNEQAFGGPLILLRPDVKVSMDGRNDLYGAEEYLKQIEVARHTKDTQSWLDENKIGCILVNGNRGINEYLGEEPAWVLKAEDANGARLWIRQ